MPNTCTETNYQAATANPTIFPTSPVYPLHRAGWLHSLSIILTRAEAAREIGADAILLILTIAVQEDAQQYHAPPRYFNAELQRMLGIRSRLRLDKARQKAVEAGWLVFLPGRDGDRSAARYWTVIPTRLNLADDVQVDVNAAREEISSACGDAGCSDGLQSGRQPVPQSATVPHPSLSHVADEPQVSTGPIVDQANVVSCARVCEEKQLSHEVNPHAEPEIRHESAADQSRVVHAAGTTLNPEIGFVTPILPKLAALESKVTDQDWRINHSYDVGDVRGAGHDIDSRASPKAPVIRGTVSNPYIDPAILAGSTTNGLALDLYLAYPKYSAGDLQQTDATKSIQAIHRALGKITYAQLILLVKRFAAIQNRPGQDRGKTPPLVTWFDEEQWRTVPKG